MLWIEMLCMSQGPMLCADGFFCACLFFSIAANLALNSVGSCLIIRDGAADA